MKKIILSFIFTFLITFTLSSNNIVNLNFNNDSKLSITLPQGFCKIEVVESFDLESINMQLAFDSCDGAEYPIGFISKGYIIQTNQKEYNANIFPELIKQQELEQNNYPHIIKIDKPKKIKKDKYIFITNSRSIIKNDNDEEQVIYHMRGMIVYKYHLFTINIYDTENSIDKISPLLYQTALALKGENYHLERISKNSNSVGINFAELLGSIFGSLIFGFLIFRFIFRNSSKPILYTWLLLFFISITLGTFNKGEDGFVSRITLNYGQNINFLYESIFMQLISVSVASFFLYLYSKK